MHHKIVVGDCADVLPTLKCKYNLVWADPPFNIGHPYKGYDDNKEPGEFFAWCRRWVRAAWDRCGGIMALHGPDDLCEAFLMIARLEGFHDHRIAWINWHYRFDNRTDLWYNVSILLSGPTDHATLISHAIPTEPILCPFPVEGKMNQHESPAPPLFPDENRNQQVLLAWLTIWVTIAVSTCWFNLLFFYNLTTKISRTNAVVEKKLEKHQTEIYGNTFMNDHQQNQLIAIEIKLGKLALAEYERKEEELRGKSGPRPTLEDSIIHPDADPPPTLVIVRSVQRRPCPRRTPKTILGTLQKF